jgi:hypothetical protein
VLVLVQHLQQHLLELQLVLLLLLLLLQMLLLLQPLQQLLLLLPLPSMRTQKPPTLAPLPRQTRAARRCPVSAPGLG